MDDPTYMNTPDVCKTCLGSGVEYDGSVHQCTACNGVGHPPVKECAAQVRGMACRHPRAKDSLFCQQHAHASNRIMLFHYVSADALAQKVQP